jgi:hypothetical protein
MKKLLTTLAFFGMITASFFAFKPAATPMAFETVSATVNPSSIIAYTTGTTVDSTSASVIARFGVVGNPYTKGEMFTAYAVIKMTLNGDARVSDFQVQAQVAADAYRAKNYPNIK